MSKEVTEFFLSRLVKKWTIFNIFFRMELDYAFYFIHKKSLEDDVFWNAWADRYFQ